MRQESPTPLPTDAGLQAAIQRKAHCANQVAICSSFGNLLWYSCAESVPSIDVDLFPDSSIFQILTDSMTANPASIQRYSRFLLFIAGVGGLLYGIDVGIIAAALLYLGKTINLTVEETSIIVAAVLGGSMVSSLVAGVLADLLGRRSLMIVSGLMFVASIGVIVLSNGFLTLFMGRLLQGMSGGVIAVVVPLYLAECLGANNRGRGTAVFQFMLTFGIVCAAAIGWFYTRQAENAIALAGNNAVLIHAAQNRAWRSMFLCVVYPGLLFFAGSFVLKESPRWLLMRGRPDDAMDSLRRAATEQEAEAEFREMQTALRDRGLRAGSGKRDSLLRRKYVVPFVLACVIMVCNQTTGINSILGFLVIILRQAGMTASKATQGDVAVKVLNCVMTLIAVFLIDRKGRKFLLTIGTAGIIAALLAGGILFLGVESKRVDIRDRIEAAEAKNTLSFPVNASTLGESSVATRPMSLAVLYSYGNGDHIETSRSDDPNPVLTIRPEAENANAPLQIKRALYGPVPSESTGWCITACLALFIAFYSVGPGVVVWLALSELMPTRIRSVGMGITLLMNQGASTLIAAAFLPVVGKYGYATAFFFWAACTVVYFVTATFFLPETRGKTLEDIEMHFESGDP
jgi:MFS transporter, SP family, solute carrier family 2 (myo-inositol transporter), member 13